MEMLILEPEFRGFIKNEIKPFETVDIDLSNGTSNIHARVTGRSNKLPLQGEGIGKPKTVASFDTMVDSLDNKIKIEDKDKDKLCILIRENSYYRVSYFAKLLFINGLESKPSFDDFYSLISFDSYIRASISRLTPSVEVFAKSTLAHELLKVKDNSEIYLDHSIYKYNSASDKKKLDRTLSVCATSVQRDKSHNESIKHYVSSHDGHVPIWAFFDVLTFGEFNMLSNRLEKRVLDKWFTYIVNDRPISKTDLYIEARSKSLPSFFQTIQLLRNASAHNSRIYGNKFVYNPSIKKGNNYWKVYIREKFECSDAEISRQIHSLFTGLMVLRFFYACMSQGKIDNWNKFVKHLQNHIQQTTCTNLGGYLGFPDNWLELLVIS